MTYWNISFNPRIDRTNPEIVDCLCKIEAQKISLSRIPLPPEIRKNFDSVNVTNQIKASTRIEGSQLSDKQVEEAMLKSQSDSYEEKEIIAAYNLHKHIVDTAKLDSGVVITEELIKEFHFIITKDINDDDYHPGEFRKDDLIVGRNFKPTRFEEIPSKIKEFLNYINSEAAISLGSLIRAVLAHFYLVSIHPFQNGNGRTSRALEAYILYCGGYNQLGFYSLSNFYYKNYKKYFEELDDARFKYGGDLNHFILLALNGFLEEVTQIAAEAFDFVSEKMFKDYLLESYRRDDLKISKRAYQMAVYLLETKAKITKKKISTGGDPFFNNLLDRVSLKTVNRDIKRLTDIELLKWVDDELRVNIEIMQKFI